MLFLTKFVALLLVTLLSNTAYSSSFLKAENQCELYSNITTKENIGDVKTNLGKEYEIILDNNHNENYLNIKVNAAYPENRWVKRSCGVVKSSKKFVPFFVVDQANK